MTKEIALKEFFTEIIDNPPFRELRPLSFYVSREFANYPSADPADFYEQIVLLCKPLSLDPDEMLTLIAGAIEAVKYPRGVAYENVIERAKKEPKRFRGVFKGKRFLLINIFYQFSLVRTDGIFNIPAQMVAASVHTPPRVVTGFITELMKRGIIAKIMDEVPHKTGRLFKWVEQPLN